MKKSLLFLIIYLLLAGCSNEVSGTNNNTDENTKKEYTDKFEYSLVEKVSETITKESIKKDYTEGEIYSYTEY